MIVARGAGDVAGKGHWEKTWRDMQPQPYPGPIFEFAPLLERYLPRDTGFVALEIGAMPGNNLVYLNKRFGYRVHAVDYVDDVRLLNATFGLNGITDYRIFQCDVFAFEPSQLYDVVFSSGFVEHFSDYEAVFWTHVRLTRPGGYVVIFIPNTTRLHALLMRQFCPDLLSIHVRHLMSRWVLNELCAEHGLDVLYCNYLKTYRAFYPVPRALELANRGIIKALNAMRLSNIPNSFASPFVYLVARRRDEEGRGTP